jgi:putative membrane protein
MDTFHGLALALHIVGFATWLGGLNAMARVLAARNDEADAGFQKKMGAMARKGGRVADVGAGLAIAGGTWLLSYAPGMYMSQGWMHMKLTLVLALIGAHGFVRMKAKKAAEGQGSFPAVMVPVLVLAGALIVGLAVLKPLAH